MFRLSQTNRIEVNVTAKRLTLYQGSQPLYTYPVAIGKSQTPTPLGHWKVVNKKVISEPSVFGSRWIGLSAPSYGIHGTNNPSSIGTAASLGCVRLYNRDVEELFPLVSIGTPVDIVRGGAAGSTSGGKSYTVRPGDTLWHIAQSHGVQLDQLLAINPHVAPHSLNIGQTIKLP